MRVRRELPTSTHSHWCDGENQAGSTLRFEECPAAETPGTCRGRCCLVVPPAPGHSGLSSFQAFVPGGGGDPRGGRARMLPLGKVPEPFRIEKQPHRGASCVELSVIRPGKEVQAGALPCPHRQPSCVPPPPLSDPDRASQTLCSPGWERLGGFPREEVPQLHVEGKGLSPGFRSAVLALRVP